MLPSTDPETFICSPPTQASTGASPKLSVRSFGMTEKGAVRETNEDQYLIATMTKALRIGQSSLPQPATKCGDDEGHLFLVADGFGGAPAGEEASAIAVESIEGFVANTLKWFFRAKGPEHEIVLAEFQEALRLADARVFEESLEHPEWSGMGTTLTLAYSLRDRLFVAHAGDSRCYLFHAGKLLQLTRDHTLAAIFSGKEAPESNENERRRYAHVITNAIGGRTPGVRPEIRKHIVAAGDVLLLATDGLTRYVTDERIAAGLEGESDPQTACERLVTEALEAGGRDNVTAIVARYEMA